MKVRKMQVRSVGLQCRYAMQVGEGDKQRLSCRTSYLGHSNLNALLIVRRALVTQTYVALFPLKQIM
jgi:hypothetical protein